ncbi:MAG TPA: sigma-70 family RNA polymerase sigma factor, partial [Polyangiaceae bacterium]
RLASLLLSYIQAVCAFVAPRQPGASTAIIDRLSHSQALSVLKVLRSGNVRDDQDLDRYVFGTCRNTAMAMHHGNARQRRIADATAGVLPQSYDAPWMLADKARLESCLERLQKRARAVIIATFIDERDTEEIGRSMGLSAANVRVIRHRALAVLQRSFIRTRLFSLLAAPAESARPRR